MAAGFIPPNSKTAGFTGAGAPAPCPICMLALSCGRASVNPAFFSTALNVVSSCKIIGAGSDGFAAGAGACGICIAGFGATGAGGGGGIFDHPTLGSGVGWLIVVEGFGLISCKIFGEVLSVAGLKTGIWNLSKRSTSMP